MITRRLAAVAWITTVTAASYYFLLSLNYLARSVSMGILGAICVIVWLVFAVQKAMTLWKKL